MKVKEREIIKKNRGGKERIDPTRKSKSKRKRKKSEGLPRKRRFDRAMMTNV